MNKKIERELHGPSWTEVILGALLSLLLGVLLAFLYLVLRPVAVARETPKEAAAGVVPGVPAVHYVEGARGAGSSAPAAAKQQAFLDGGSVVLNEQEMNTLLAPAATAAAPETADASAVKPGVVNFRIREGVLQMAVPVQVSAFGLDHRVIVQTRGGFAKSGERFVFEPQEFYLGSCPLHRLPVVENMIMERIMKSAALPADVTTAWQRLAGVAVEGSTLRLTVE